MPWHIEEQDGEYCVIKDADDTVEGCHDTRDDAEDQMAALYASEAERVGLFDWLRGQLTPLLRFFKERAWSGDASNYDSTEAYCSACLIDVNSAAGNDEKKQSHCMLPVKSAGSDSINWEAIQAAAGGHGIQAVKKPSDVSDEEWESAMKSAANKIISEYNSHDEKAPDAVYEIAGKEPPERALSLELAFDQIYTQMWESDELSGAWIHDFYFGDDGDPFILMSRQGKLYRVGFSLDGDSVVLGEMEPIEIHFEPAERIVTRTVIREVEPGVFRWLSISATSVLNKDGEIDSQELFDNFIARIDETGDYPVRRFHHVDHPKFVTGQADYVARDRHTLITSGLFNDSELARREIAVRLEDPDVWGESIAYLPKSEAQIIRVSGVEIPVYVDGVLREISTVEQENACSWFTTTVMSEEVQRMSLTQRAREALGKLFEDDEDSLNDFLEGVTLTNRSIEQEGLISREEEDPEEETRETEDPEPEVEAEPEAEERETEDPREFILDDEALTAIAEQFSGVLEPVRERLSAIEGRLETIEGEQTRSLKDAARQIADLKERIAELEREEEEKHDEWLADMSPRMRQTRISYRPRVDRTDEEDQVPEFQAIANKTLETLPT